MGKLFSLLGVGVGKVLRKSILQSSINLLPSLIPVREKIIVNYLSAYPGTFRNPRCAGSQAGNISALSLSLSFLVLFFLLCLVSNA